MNPLTIVEVSDIQFGRRHRFAPDGPGALADRLVRDLRMLRERDGLVPDLLVLPGDLAEWGLPEEYVRVEAFLRAMCAGLGLGTDRVVTVPGNHDVNRALCAEYVDNDPDPRPPYWPKWEPYAAMYARFHGRELGRGTPWSLIVLPELATVVAELNSTIAESHRDEDHYGWLGEEQLAWFADRLAPYALLGWWRVGVLHHNPVRGAGADDAHLHDADLFVDRLAGQLDVVLHGHTHHARTATIGPPPGLPVVGAGSAGVDAAERPDEVPNQYQVVRLDGAGLTVWARRYDPHMARWMADSTIGADNGVRTHPVTWSRHPATNDAPTARTPHPPGSSPDTTRITVANNGSIAIGGNTDGSVITSFSRRAEP